MRACVHVRERERECVCVCTCVRAHACVCVCMCACLPACLPAYVCVCSSSLRPPCDPLQLVQGKQNGSYNAGSGKNQILFSLPDTTSRSQLEDGKKRIMSTYKPPLFHVRAQVAKNVFVREATETPSRRLNQQTVTSVNLRKKCDYFKQTLAWREL